MNDLDALMAALDHLPAISGVASDRHSIPADRLLIIVNAARERLAQLVTEQVIIREKATL